MLPSHARVQRFCGIFLGYRPHYPILLYNLLAWFLASLYFAFSLARMMPFSSVHSVIALYSGILGTFCNLKAWLTCPGVQSGKEVTQQEGKAECQKLNKFKSKELSIQTFRHCNTCQLVREPLTSHCKACNYCIRKFDHHCPYIANCVGEDNLKWFVGMLLVYCLALLYYFCSALLLLGKILVDNQINVFSLWQSIQLKDKFILFFCGILLISIRRTNMLLFSTLILIALLFGPFKTSGVLELLQEQLGCCLFLLFSILNWELVLMNGWPALQGWLTGQTLKQRL